MALKYQGNDVLDVRFNGNTVNKVNFNGVTVWEREVPPQPMRDVWTIRWFDDITSEELNEDEEVIWSVLDKVLPISFESNSEQFGSFSVDFEGAISYGNKSVYETSGGQRGWNYDNINYKEIKMYINPNTVFINDWAEFLNHNGLVTHTQEPIN